MATPETTPIITENEALQHINADYTERYGFHDPENYLYKAPKGLTREIVEKISEFKSEPQWMRDFRLKALDHFLARPMPTWGSPVLAQVDFDDIHYFVPASERAVWSGGSFVYVPPGVSVEMPLQAYFRINTENMGQFERTLIIADEGSYVHYVEGCTAPTYSSDSLHSAVVELIAKPGARIRYTTVQNWSQNVFNLVTKRAIAQEHATVEWVDCNLGSKLTMKYPSVYLLDEESRSDTYPTIRIGEDDVNVGHEATVSKIGDEQLFYLKAHGIPEDEASKMIVNGFIEPITKELPMEYAVEMNRLIELQMEGSIG